MENIELFNKYTAIVFSRLYKTFPNPISLNSNEIASDTLSQEESWEPDHTKGVSLNLDPSSEEYPKQRTKIFKEHVMLIGSTVHWLKDCNYILSPYKENENHSYVLSPKGFEVLSSIPDSVNPVTFGQKLVNISENVAKETNKAVISETIGLIIGSAWKASIGN